MRRNRGKNSVSVAAKNDDSHRYAILVSGEIYIADQENTVIRPKPMISPDHSSKKIDNDQDLEELGKELSLAPSFKKIQLMDDDQDLEEGTKLSLAPPGPFYSSSPGFIHPPPPPPQLQQPPVPGNIKPFEFFDVLERIKLLEKLSYVCSSHSTTYGHIDEKGAHENANNDDQKEEPEAQAESDDIELDLTLKL